MTDAEKQGLDAAVTPTQHQHRAGVEMVQQGGEVIAHGFEGQRAVRVVRASVVRLSMAITR